jgi:hypothetical protein
MSAQETRSFRKNVLTRPQPLYLAAVPIIAGLKVQMTIPNAEKTPKNKQNQGLEAGTSLDRLIVSRDRLVSTQGIIIHE